MNRENPTALSLEFTACTSSKNAILGRVLSSYRLTCALVILPAIITLECSTAYYDSVNLMIRNVLVHRVQY